MYLIGIVFAFLSALLFGVSNIFVMKGFVNIEPRFGVYVTLLFSFAAILFLSVADGSIFGISSLGGISIALFALVGFLNFAVGRSLNYTSISLSGPSTTSALISFRIVFAVIFSLIIIHEAYTPLRVIGDILMFIGITAVTFSHGISRKMISRGVILALLASAVAGLCDVLISLANSTSGMPISGLLVSYIAGIATYTPFMFSTKSPVIRDQNSSKNRLYLLLTGVGVFSGIAQAARFFSLSIAPVSIAVPIISLTPIITVFLSFIFLKSEKLNSRFISGVLVAFAGSIFLSI